MATFNILPWLKIERDGISVQNRKWLFANHDACKSITLLAEETEDDQGVDYENRCELSTSRTATKKQNALKDHNIFNLIIWTLLKNTHAMSKLMFWKTDTKRRNIFCFSFVRTFISNWRFRFNVGLPLNDLSVFDLSFILKNA